MILFLCLIQEVSRGLQELDKSRIDRDEELDKLYQQKDHLENGLEKLQNNLITVSKYLTKSIDFWLKF